MLFRIVVDGGFFISSLFGAAFFVPQLLKLYTRKTAQDLSLLTFLGFNIIQLFVIFHGVLHQDILLILASISKFLPCCMIAALIMLYRYFSVNKGVNKNDSD